MQALFIIAAIFAITLFGFALQFIKCWILKLVCLFEKKHTEKEDHWVYKI